MQKKIAYQDKYRCHTSFLSNSFRKILMFFSRYFLHERSEGFDSIYVLYSLFPPVFARETDQILERGVRDENYENS